MKQQRIVSLVPSATEMVAELGLLDRLVGVSHECNWPKEVRKLPVVVSAAHDLKDMKPGEVDALVSRQVNAGKPLYQLDEDMLRLLEPDLILTQDLCDVCALSGESFADVVAKLPKKPQVLSMSPRSLTDIAQNMRDLGKATGKESEAEVALIEWKARVDDVQARVQSRERVRCFVMEWVDPIYCSGHWIAEMVQMAGGMDLLARPGQDSVAVEWEEVCASKPEVLIIAPCGYNLDQSSDQLSHLQGLSGWEELPAVQQKRVYAVNADAFVTRPGPRVVDGIEMLAYLLHNSP